MAKLYISALMLLLTFSQLAAVQDDALIVYFDFEDLSGDIVKDKSGKGNDGTIVGGDAVVTDGKRGKGLELDGQDDHVRIEYNESLLLDDALTFAGWFYFTNLEPNNNLIDTRLPDQWKDAGFNIWIKDATRDSIISPNADGWAGTADSKTSATERTWTHIAMSVDNANGAVSLYLNGSLDSEADVTKGGMGVSEQPMIIGARADIQAAKCLYGTMDEIAVWNVALASQEIKTVYQTGIVPVFPAGSISTTWGNLKSR
ncbi:LamG domain-containing protein [Candidatus Poribacteria bacterium]